MLPTPHSHLALKVFEKNVRTVSFEPEMSLLKLSVRTTAPSSRWPLSNLIIMKIMRMAESVLSLKIYDKLVFSRRLEIRQNNFLIDFD